MKDTGGSAFPTSPNKEDPVWAAARDGGMTLRDYFAAKADVSIYTPLANIRSKLKRDPTIQELADYVAELRFIEASAMLAARGDT